ncbi:hypothetical protein [Arthrobacter rhombi]|uniref:hypothetical protein n=1 Tax=Arthrobacter rhombi TaxID=71253 RepID=UPI003FD1149A
MAPYEAACTGTDVDAIDLYRWAGKVALATFEDLATLEVAMRSAMANELAAAYGIEWYQRADLLDEDTISLIQTARRIGRLDQLSAPLAVKHGKLVATLMFGFWVKVLGRGGHHGRGPARVRRIYDTLLWKPALRNAFPNVGDFDRTKVETAARRVQALRNRVAHHEHIVWGVPLPGETTASGGMLRLPFTDAHECLLQLAGYVDAELEDWLRQHSNVPTAIRDCPLPHTTSLLL